AEGHFIWPGFGDNMRVLMWILDRCQNKVDAVETPIGYIPNAEDIDLTGLKGTTTETVRDLLSIDNKLWLEDAAGVEELYAMFGDRLPSELAKQLADQKNRLSK
ncbi:MAG: phosphoenolpyruvate carboxykinase domain-containing protein, partial [Oscillospiraceae bacterium]